MDPNDCLAIILRIAKRIDDGVDVSGADASMLAEYVLALDEWLKKAGFLPARWAAGRPLQPGGNPRA